MNVTQFQPGDWVDVIGRSKGKGFQGVMKKHNFAGQGAAHGSKTHRRNGAIGNRSTPGRIWKNMGMPGHMGDERVTVQNLQVMQVREEEKSDFDQRCGPRIEWQLRRRSACHQETGGGSEEVNERKSFNSEAAKDAKIDVIENGRGTQAVHDVVVAMRAARRSGSANTKTKADVNLSGAKPWRQKGTGRARAGYKSSPDLAWWRCRLRPQAARLFKESFQDDPAPRFSQGAERADQGRRRADGRQVRGHRDQDQGVRRIC